MKLQKIVGPGIRKYMKSSKVQGLMMIIAYMGFLLMCSLAIVFMPIASENRENMRWLLTADGLLFWFGIIGTVIMTIIVNRCRKKDSQFRKRHPEKRKIGLITFFQNIFAIVADITMGVSVVALIVFEILADNLFVVFALMGLLVFSFGMHCMLNGINYLYINYRIKER